MVVPIEVDTRKFVAGPIFGDGEVFFEDIAEVMGVVFANILNAKVIYYETEIDWAPFVAPEARRDESLVVAGSMEAIGEEIIGKLSRLPKPIDALAYLKLYPTVA